MTKDFSKYQHIIDSFRGQVSSPDFEASFADATKKIEKTERFLLKMELKRLASPCMRLVDLRGHVDGECYAFEHEGRTHYLDDIAVKVFEENVAYYGDYTFGVYEAVMNTENNFRVMYKKEKSALQSAAPIAEKRAKINEKLQYPAKLYSFGPYFDRREERMNFAIPISVDLGNGKVVQATSSDISVNGCKFRFLKPIDLKARQIIHLRFDGLEEEFQFKNEDSYEYEVRNIQLADTVQLVGVQRVYHVDENRDGLRKFLDGYIQGNKRRYKINLDNTIKALQSRCFEQYVLPKSNELPIFIQEDSHGLLPKYALTCHNNQAIYQYWQDERKTSTLHCLVTPDRIQRLKQARKLGQALYVYSFVHQSQNKSYFYTADNMQLAEDKSLMLEFLGFAATKSGFSITHLSLLDVDLDKANSPLTLANTIAKKDLYLNHPIPEDIIASLASVRYIAVANEINEQQTLEQYSQLTFDNINVSKIKKFGHKRLKHGLNVEDVGINYNNHRKEPRFVYKSPVVIECGGVTWHGKSEDFSASGLKVELDKATVLKNGDVVNISFPQLQKITKSFELKGLPYEIMRINKKKTVLNLRVYVAKHQHIGRAFFKALIEKNKDTLTKDEYQMMRPELGKALRNIYSSSLTIPSLIVQTSGSRYKMEVVACNSDRSRILGFCHQLSDRQNYYNLYPLLNNLQATSLMNSTLKKMASGDHPIVDILYIAISSEVQSVDKAVITKLESELSDNKAKSDFIKNALKKGSFLCMQVKLSRTDKPDIEHLNPELSYIGSYAIHRGKQLEQEIWSVAGVVQLLDITQEAMVRYHTLLSDVKTAQSVA